MLQFSPRPVILQHFLLRLRQVARLAETYGTFLGVSVKISVGAINSAIFSARSLRSPGINPGFAPWSGVIAYRYTTAAVTVCFPSMLRNASGVLMNASGSRIFACSWISCISSDRLLPHCNLRVYVFLLLSILSGRRGSFKGGHTEARGIAQPSSPPIA